MQALGMKQRRGCIYHPQSQGLVKRANGILKAKIAKICKLPNLNWLDAMSIALMHMRSQIKHTTHLTSHEVPMRRAMPIPRIQGDGRSPPLKHLQREIRSYVQQLFLFHKIIYLQVMRQELLSNPQVDVQYMAWLSLETGCMQRCSGERVSNPGERDHTE